VSKYDLQEIYKDLYYHELDVREKITNRLQITFAFHATALTVIAYMSRMIDYQSNIYLLGVFYLSLFIALIFLSRSIFETIKAFWGNTYKGLASADKIEKYRKNCLQHKNDLDTYKSKNPSDNIADYSPELKINNYLYLEFSKCASHNANINDARSKRIHTATKYLLYFCIPFLIVSVLFTVFDMDASSPRKKLLLEYQGIVNSIDKLPILSQDEIIYIINEAYNNNIEKVFNERNKVSINNNNKIIKEIESSTESIINVIKSISQHKEKTMTEEEKKPEKQEIPPEPPKPPEPRDLIESQEPDIKIEK